MEVFDIYKQSFFFFITRYKTLLIAMLALSLLRWLILPVWLYDQAHFDQLFTDVEQLDMFMQDSAILSMMILGSIVEIFGFAFMFCLFRTIVERPELSSTQLLLMTARQAPLISFYLVFIFAMLLIIFAVLMGLVFLLANFIGNSAGGIGSILTVIGFGSIFYISLRLILLPMLIVEQPSLRFVYLITKSFAMTRGMLFKITMIMLMYTIAAMVVSLVFFSGWLNTLGEVSNLFVLLVSAHLSTFFMVVLYRMYIDCTSHSENVQ